MHPPGNISHAPAVSWEKLSHVYQERKTGMFIAALFTVAKPELTQMILKERGDE